MDCEEFARLLDNYENLTIEEKAALREHSEVCEKCRAELEFSRAVTETVRTLPKLEVPSDFMQTLNRRIDSEERFTRKNKLIKHLCSNWQKYSTAAACLALVAVVGFNGKSLVDKMENTDDDGVIYETSSGQLPTDNGTDAMPSSVPSASSAPKDSADGERDASKDNAAVSENNGTASEPAQKGTENTSSGTGNTESASGRSSSVSETRGASSSASSGGSGSSDTRRIYSNSYGSGSEGSSGSGSYGTGTSESAYTSSEYSGGTAAAPTAQTAQGSTAETEAATESEGVSEAEESEGVSIPRERYVMSHDDGGAEDAYADASGADTEDTGYSIADSESNTAVAAADTEGSPIPDQNSLVLDGLLLIREADYDAACGIIDSYISSVYGSCYMITPDNLSKLCSAMQSAGIEFENSISADRSQVTFRVIKY